MRRRWWIVLPACVVPLTTVAVLSKIPNRYTSNATLVVVQQQVPQRYVVPNDTTEMAVALQAMQQEVLSRPQLERIIRDFGLYAKESKRKAPEQIMALMLRDIDIEPIISGTPQKDLNAFQHLVYHGEPTCCPAGYQHAHFVVYPGESADSGGAGHEHNRVSSPADGGLQKEAGGAGAAVARLQDAVPRGIT